MRREYPFYAVVRGIGAVDAYHTHSACQIAQSIEACYRSSNIPEGCPVCTCCLTHWAVGTKHIPFTFPECASTPAPSQGTSYRARIAQNIKARVQKELKNASEKD